MDGGCAGTFKRRGAAGGAVRPVSGGAGPSAPSAGPVHRGPGPGGGRGAAPRPVPAALGPCQPRGSAAALTGRGGGGRARRFAGSSRGEGSSGGRGAHGSRFEPRRRAVVARAAFPRGSGTLRARAPALAPGRGGGGGSGGCPGSRGGDPAAPLPVVLPAP